MSKRVDNARYRIVFVPEYESSRSKPRSAWAIVRNIDRRVMNGYFVPHGDSTSKRSLESKRAAENELKNYFDRKPHSWSEPWDTFEGYGILSEDEQRKEPL